MCCIHTHISPYLKPSHICVLCVCVYLNYIPLPTQVSDSAAAYVLTSTYTFFQQKNKNVTAPCTFTHIFSNNFKLFDQLQQENRTSAVLLLGVVTALLYVFFFSSFYDHQYTHQSQ